MAEIVKSLEAGEINLNGIGRSERKLGKNDSAFMLAGSTARELSVSHRMRRAVREHQHLQLRGRAPVVQQLGSV